MSYCKCEVTIGNFIKRQRRIYKIDFKSMFKEKENGRMFLFEMTCENCGNIQIYGTSFCDYRTTGYRLVIDAIDHLTNRNDIQLSKEKATEEVLKFIGKINKKRILKEMLSDENRFNLIREERLLITKLKSEVKRNESK